MSEKSARLGFLVLIVILTYSGASAFSYGVGDSETKTAVITYDELDVQGYTENQTINFGKSIDSVPECGGFAGVAYICVLSVTIDVEICADIEASVLGFPAEGEACIHTMGAYSGAGSISTIITNLTGHAYVTSYEKPYSVVKEGCYLVGSGFECEDPEDEQMPYHYRQRVVWDRQVCNEQFNYFSRTLNSLLENRTGPDEDPVPYVRHCSVWLGPTKDFSCVEMWGWAEGAADTIDNEDEAERTRCNYDTNAEIENIYNYDRAEDYFANQDNYNVVKSRLIGGFEDSLSQAIQLNFDDLDLYTSEDQEVFSALVDSLRADAIAKSATYLNDQFSSDGLMVTFYPDNPDLRPGELRLSG